MVAEVHTDGALADRLARIDAELDAISLGDYALASASESRHNAAALRRLESRIRTHVGAAVRAVADHTPRRDASRNLANDHGHDPQAARRELRARTDAEGWKYKRIKGVMHIDRGKGKGWEVNHRYRP